MPGSPTQYGPVPAEFRAPGWAYLICLALSIVLYGAVVGAGLKGNWAVTGLAAFIGSYGIMAFTRTVIGPVSLREAFNPKTQSWAMLCDLFLVIAIALAASVYPHLYGASNGWSWPTPAAYLAGLAVGAIWHFFLDKPNYVKEGGAALLYDPAKLGHDLVVWTVLAGALFRLVLPVVFSGLWLHSLVPWLILICLCIYVFVGMKHDAGGLPIFKIHSAYDWRTYQPAPNFRLPRLRG